MEIGLQPIDKGSFYKVELFGDGISGAIHRMTPILPDGSDDPIRTVQFKIVTALQFPDGQVLNVNTEIPGAKTLEEAIDAFSSTLSAYATKAIEDAQTEARRQAFLQGHAGRGPANGRPPRR